MLFRSRTASYLHPALDFVSGPLTAVPGARRDEEDAAAGEGSAAHGCGVDGLGFGGRPKCAGCQGWADLVSLLVALIDS